MWHSHDFNGRFEINQDGTSHNVMLLRYLAGHRLIDCRESKVMEWNMLKTKISVEIHSKCEHFLCE